MEVDAGREEKGMKGRVLKGDDGIEVRSVLDEGLLQGELEDDQ